ncbi:MAG: hypothetical protein M3Q73_03090 [bacterium]|nr:hypothetical protein [bacterium]
MNRQALIHGIALLVIVASGFFMVKDDGFSTHKSEQGQIPEATEEMPEEEFQIIRDKYVALAQNKNPKIALAALREEIKTNAPLMRSCHGLVHEIGHKAYEIYQDFGEAMKYQDEICNSGYLHGIIESHFSSSTDLFAAMNTVCDKYPTGSFIGWECFHGVGHGVMYFTNDDLPRSIELCTAYQTEFARSHCRNGVFMENFNADQKLHISQYLKALDPFYPCAEQSEENKVYCYSYAPTYYLSIHNNKYEQALDWCKTAEKGYREICATGVGSQAMKENINNPKFVETVCQNEASNFQSSCVYGMIALYINHHGSLEPAQSMCQTLSRNSRSICTEVIKQNVSMFQL